MRMVLDYQKLGLKCGIEIHQQLDTHKLFCSCPSQIRDDKPNIIVRRKMRAVAGELGDVDPAALHEFLRDREFVYEAYSDSNCLVELDEEPPHPLNREALEIALEIVLLLNAKPVDELQVMRKTVIDGSNTSGFQRTILVGMDGFLETDNGRVGIPTICLEEDAARKIEEKGKTTTYRLDRLGIPLVEICTDSEIKGPKHAREVAEKLGMILRVTGRVKRGIGTIRQDLNVSISEGERIEVKGVQELRLTSKVVEEEVKRQLILIEIKKELKKRKVREEDLNYEFVDVTDIFKDTKSKVILNSLKKDGFVMVTKLKGFSNLLKDKLSTELAQYARVIGGVKWIFHSDELPAYGITREEILKINKKLKLRQEDAFVLVAEKRSIAESALRAVVDRCRLALKGVPKETRRALPDGKSEFMRPLPGSARMYPETDEPLVVIDDEFISEIKKKLPEMPEKKIERFLSMGLSKELANQLLKSKWAAKFEEFKKEFSNVKPSVIATTIISTPKEVKKRYKVEISFLREDHYGQILDLVNRKKISKGVIPEIMAELAKDPEKDVEKIVVEKDLFLISEGEIERIVDRILKENRKLIQDIGEKAKGYIIGRVMAEVKGRADVESVKGMINRKLKSVHKFS